MINLQKILSKDIRAYSNNFPDKLVTFSDFLMRLFNSLFNSLIFLFSTHYESSHWARAEVAAEPSEGCPFLVLF